MSWSISTTRVALSSVDPGSNRSGPCASARAMRASRVALATSMGPIRSRHLSTSSSGERGRPAERNRAMMSWTPGLVTSDTSSTAKLTRSFKAPLSIHSIPVCQPSTVGGLNSCCPMFIEPLSLPKSGSGNRWVHTSLMIPDISSTGLLIFLNRASLKESRLNSVLSTGRI